MFIVLSSHLNSVFFVNKCLSLLVLSDTTGKKLAFFASLPDTLSGLLASSDILILTQFVTFLSSVLFRLFFN